MEPISTEQYFVYTQCTVLSNVDKKDANIMHWMLLVLPLRMTTCIMICIISAKDIIDGGINILSLPSSDWPYSKPINYTIFYAKTENTCMVSQNCNWMVDIILGSRDISLKLSHQNHEKLQEANNLLSVKFCTAYPQWKRHRS